MTMFDNREKAFEDKFAHSEAIEFKIINKARISTAKWAAEKMAYNAQKTEDLINSVVDLGIESKNDDAIIAKIYSEFQASSVRIDKEEVHRHLALAYNQIRQEFKN